MLPLSGPPGQGFSRMNVRRCAGSRLYFVSRDLVRSEREWCGVAVLCEVLRVAADRLSCELRVVELECECDELLWLAPPPCPPRASTTEGFSITAASTTASRLRTIRPSRVPPGIYTRALRGVTSRRPR